MEILTVDFNMLDDDGLVLADADGTEVSVGEEVMAADYEDRSLVFLGFVASIDEEFLRLRLTYPVINLDMPLLFAGPAVRYLFGPRETGNSNVLPRNLTFDLVAAT